MKRIVKCCRAVALGSATVGYAKDVVHKKIQLWKDGPYWAETNIGAEKPWESGYYFWWGDTVGYKRVNDIWMASDGATSGFSFDESGTPTYGKDTSYLRAKGWVTIPYIVFVLAPEHDAAKVHWGGEWRIPRDDELDGLDNKCEWIWTTTNGVNGYIVRGKGTYASSCIFLPAAGYGCGTSLYTAGSHGGYWSSFPGSQNVASEMLFDSKRHGTAFTLRRLGRTIRPVHGEQKTLSRLTQMP